MEKFADYMVSLLFGPLKKVRRQANQFYIYFSVIGGLFDDAKEKLFAAREACLISTAPALILNEFGKDRDMPWIQGEDAEAYRARLMAKNVIAEYSGTNYGLLLALRALGYPDAYIEPMYLFEQDRWAEALVYPGANTSGITDVRLIDPALRKIKPASARLSYAAEETRKLMIQSSEERRGLVYPMCGLQQTGAPVNLY